MLLIMLLLLLLTSIEYLVLFNFYIIFIINTFISCLTIIIVFVIYDYNSVLGYAHIYTIAMYLVCTFKSVVPKV